MFHSIKGASVVMGFTPVNQLTHHLESLFEQLRSRKRELDRPTLDLTFRCLDELRDYHKNLRAQGQGAVDLTGLIAQVVDFLHATPPADVAARAGGPRPETSPPLTAAAPASGPTAPFVPTAGPAPAFSAPREGFGEPASITLTVIFEPMLPLADMKARLVLNRLAAKARILSTDPSAEQLDEIDPLTRLAVYLASEADLDELRGLADVEGVAEIHIEPQSAAGVRAVVAASAGKAEPELEWAEHAAPGSSAVGAPATGPPRYVELEETPADAPEAAPVQTSLSASVPAAPSASAKVPGATKKAKITETIRVDSDRLDYLMNLAGELVITKARFVAIARSLEELFRGSSAAALTSDTRERLESLTRGLDGLSEIKSGSAGESLDRWSVHVRRLRDNFRAIQDELGLIGEAREQIKSLSETIHSLGRVSDGLQKGVLDTRMVPIGPLFERFRRVIRDLSISSGKEVTLQLGGEKTELDKRMIDELSDPLIHMVRNAVDHGLEPPGDREAVGKPRAGMVSLQASHRGNSVVITVSDDGHGIDCERIRKKIVAKDLMSKSLARELTDRELIAYIWHPGLSTAETITEVSGRGVGMDIVKSRIENLSGTVDVRTSLGQGTTFTIRLPLTLAIMSCLLVRIYDEIYAIPLDHIDEIVEIRPSQIYRVQGRPTIEIRKRIVALVALGDVFRWGGKDHPSAGNGARPGKNGDGAADETSDKRTVIVVQIGETTIGLVVDELIGMQEVVLKSLEKNYRAIPGLSGASILGDGRVSLILDLDAVVDLMARRPMPQRERELLDQRTDASDNERRGR
jgi:two-component system chemotaxis sensor kinase CheA